MQRQIGADFRLLLTSDDQMVSAWSESGFLRQVVSDCV